MNNSMNISTICAMFDVLSSTKFIKLLSSKRTGPGLEASLKRGLKSRWIFH